MSNPFYNYSGSIIPGTLGRAEAVAAEFQSVQAGFADLATAGTDTGSAVAYVVATPVGQPAAPLVDGDQVAFKAANTNSGNATINVNATGALPLLQYNGNNLQAGNITAGSWYTVTYNSTYGGWCLPGAVAITYTGSISSAAPVYPVQLTAVGGSSTSAMPIDAKLAISTAISPTWVGNHTFNGTSSFAGPTTISGTASVSGPLTVSGVSTFSAGVAFTSPASFSGTATVSGVLAVSGTSSFSGPMKVSGTSTFSGPMTVSGTSTFSGPMTVSGNLSISGTSTASGPFTLTGLLTAGTATFTGPVSVSGTATLGAANFSGGLVGNSATGGAQGAGTINATGLYINGTAVVAGAAFPLFVKVKTSGTTRNDTATLTNDPDLAYAITKTGTYRVKILGNTLTTSAGISININYSGSMSNSVFDGACCTGNTFNGIGSTVSTTVNNALCAFAGAGSSYIVAEAVIVATSTGTVGFAWAQQSAVAANLTLLAGSTMTVEQIA